MIVVLDTGPLGLITNPNASIQNEVCRDWMGRMVAAGHSVAIPEIADYELRRELIRGKKTRGIERLNKLKNENAYLPLTTESMLQAAVFWAEARNSGHPTADNRALDADVILAAQAWLVQNDGFEVVVATTNVRHLSRFVPAQEWSNINPDSNP